MNVARENRQISGGQNCAFFVVLVCMCVLVLLWGSICPRPRISSIKYPCDDDGHWHVRCSNDDMRVLLGFVFFWGERDRMTNFDWAKCTKQTSNYAK